jgi:hypothetical protein
VNWHEFFAALNETFGERAPLVVVTVFGLAAFIFVAILFTKALGRMTAPMAETQKTLQQAQVVLERLPGALDSQRLEFRTSAEEHRRELRAIGDTTTQIAASLRARDDEFREFVRTVRESDREHMRGIERIITAIVRKARGDDPC